MDVQGSVVAWASFVVTTIGLGGLITQASAIGDQMDPFYSTRRREYLGIWFQRQKSFPWWRIAKPPPLGPVIQANAPSGFCGRRSIYIMRIPPASAGSAGWSTLLAIFRAEKPNSSASSDPVIRNDDQGVAEKGTLAITTGPALDDDGGRDVDGWLHLAHQPLIRHKANACVSIDRKALITMLVMTNGRPVFEYKSATGYRAGFASYIGQWYITWPIGEEAIVKFARHDSLATVDVFPQSFLQRVDRCCEMVCGIVSSPATGLQVAFCGRKYTGLYKLELGKRAFQGAHAARHLYNMLGGKAYEFDFMFTQPLKSVPVFLRDQRMLHLPSREGGRVGTAQEVEVVVPPAEEAVLQHALDCLSWTSVSWSVHRGLRDILVAYAKPVMDSYRAQLSQLLLQTASDQSQQLQALGWDYNFIRSSMGHMAATAISAGVGNSGDSVRVVTDLVSVLVGDWDPERLDTVNFWRRKPEERPQSGEKLDNDTIIALTKVFVLEWSQEFDYQMYHHVPIHLLLA